MYNINHLLVEELIDDEGYEENAYKDTKGYWTIGIGHMLGENPQYKYYKWSPKKIFMTFVSDVNSSIYYIERQISNFDFLTDTRKRVLINMMFNLGPNKFAKFKNTIRAIENNDIDLAHYEMLDSKWAKIDVPNRANKLVSKWLAG